MEQPVLSDPDVYPSDEVLSSHLGKAMPSYISFTEYNHSIHPDFVERWKYYNDGKSWLFNVSRKKKTVFWMSVKDGCFRTTFYLNAKAKQSVVDSKIPAAFKKQFLDSADKKFHPITVIIKAKKDLEIYKELLEIKLGKG